MMKAIVYLDRQHAGKPYSPQDRGAWGDLDANGRPDVEEREAWLTAQYLLEIERDLLPAGVAVLPISDGSYAERHRRVNSYARRYDVPQLYLAAHLNAGGGTYGSIFYDQRSAAGQVAASRVAASLGVLVGELTAVHVVPAGPGRWERAWNTIAGIFAGRAVAICVEPAFIDSAAHAHLMRTAGLRRIGRAIARGILDYVELVGRAKEVVA